ncbi:hypothetical protein [Sphingopyxis sp. Root214]|jgi:hypothetical protein|uniref:hypothetical protein n=2 Tax=unclassified Sphingopyxis TaxID=2614943 RepID=UPI000B0D3D3E|nr:hypothetical protein [Sphingopyxis sp. Root214]
MKKMSIALLATFVASASVAPAHASAGPHFSPAGGTATAAGYGNINGNICDATAVITIGPDNHPTAGLAEYADVVFSNTGAPCNDYKVQARVYPNGDVSNVTVTYLPLATVVCASTGTYTGAVVYTGTTPVTNAALAAPISVGACTLDTDIAISGSINIVP